MNRDDRPGIVETRAQLALAACKLVTAALAMAAAVILILRACGSDP